MGARTNLGVIACVAIFIAILADIFRLPSWIQLGAWTLVVVVGIGIIFIQ